MVRIETEQILVILNQFNFFFVIGCNNKAMRFLIIYFRAKQTILVLSVKHGCLPTLTIADAKDFGSTEARWQDSSQENSHSCWIRRNHHCVGIHQKREQMQ